MTAFKDSKTYLQIAALQPERLPPSHKCCNLEAMCKNRMKILDTIFCYVQECPVNIDKRPKSFWSVF
ncbi:hypothetical protein [Candidatus Lokiarchaeum ossiferum]|uniref:hypothetical protein n=1 Tax=Candidatus Lokiarchaeum ossiferum TaxID=2951803 RepID=UPI00352F51BA